MKRRHTIQNATVLAALNAYCEMVCVFPLDCKAERCIQCEKRTEFNARILKHIEDDTTKGRINKCLKRQGL